MFFVENNSLALTTAVASLGLGVCLICINRQAFARQLRLAYYLRRPRRHKSIQIITDAEKCSNIINQLKRDCHEYRVLGFDCEWVTVGGTRRPVALLQLSSFTGLCALIRLCNFQRIPHELRELLEDEQIIKVGVAPLDDARFLAQDYSLCVNSTLDLRHVANSVGLESAGLGQMSKVYLNIELDKNWRIRCSDWEAQTLTDSQINYAANDAFVGIEIFKEFHKKVNFSAPRRSVVSFLWPNNSFDHILMVIEPFLDIRFNNSQSTAGYKKSLLKQQKHEAKVIRKFSTKARSKQMYDNCQLEAPDGELLCSCDRKKAEWYVHKNLGTITKESPFTVRLRFEPSGRAVGVEGQYYKLSKANQCVVCGKTDCYIRKYVVPRDYRKHFPPAMKNYASHDVLLLCPQCHLVSNRSDLHFRERLAITCNAAFDSGVNTKLVTDKKKQAVRSYARALLKQPSKIPQQRRSELEKLLLAEFPPGTELSEDLLQDAANFDVLTPNDDYSNHGLAVVKHYMELDNGLLELEKMWREHFLRTMKPNFMPEHWSVTHNENRITKLDKTIAISK